MRRFELHSIISLTVIAITLLAAKPAAAHFVWVDVVNVDGKPAARVMFGEAAAPGEPHLLAKIAKSEAWARLADGSTSDLKLTAPTDEKAAAAYSASLPPNASTVEAVCDYGVYTRAPGGVRLWYYAEFLAAGTRKYQPSERLTLQIVPEIADGRLAVQVLYAGRPDPKAELVVVDSDGQSEAAKVDEQGRARFELPKSGLLALRAKHVAADESGEIGGQRYAQTWYCATLVVAPPAGGPPAERNAAEALTRARDGRATWHDFPGFTTDVTVRSDDGNLEARATIDSAGVVELSGDRSALHDWAEQQLQSLVQHRMPDGEVAEGNVTFVAETATHPMGRLIDLGDAERQSRYRLKDDVIMEVNRLMGPQRFTISVLAIHRNDDGKYLPEAFTMTFWDVRSGDLKQSLAYWNSWRRVGAFDLPERILEISAGPKGAKTTELTFSDQRLLGRPAQAARTQP